MKKLMIVMVALLVGSIGFAAVRRGLGHRAQQSGPPYAPTENKLQWYAQQAKANGKQQVNVPAPEIDYGGSSPATTLDKALSVYDVVIARPLESRTIVNEDEIFTWYKFKIVESLVTQSHPACAGCESPVPPREFASLGAGEFAAAKIGGSVVVDGVTLTMDTPSFPPFTNGKQYLLFISKYPNGAAEIGAGPNGVFALDEAGKLTSVNAAPHPIKQGLQTITTNSVDGLRAYAANRHLSR